MKVIYTYQLFGKNCSLAPLGMLPLSYRGPVKIEGLFASKKSSITP